MPSSSVTDRSRRRSAAPSPSLLRVMRPTPSPCSARSKRIERNHQRGGAARGRGPVGQPRIVVDQPVERALHDGEGGRRLHHLAERHRAVEIFRRAQDDRQHRRDEARRLRDNRRLHVLDGRCRARPRAPCRASGRRRRAPPPRPGSARCFRRSRAAASARSGTRPRTGSCSSETATKRRPISTIEPLATSGVDHRRDDEEARDVDRRRRRR